VIQADSVFLCSDTEPAQYVSEVACFQSRSETASPNVHSFSHWIKILSRYKFIILSRQTFKIKEIQRKKDKRTFITRRPELHSFTLCVQGRFCPKLTVEHLRIHPLDVLEFSFECNTIDK
jgi:hypothetical protein